MSGGTNDPRATGPGGQMTLGPQVRGTSDPRVRSPRGGHLTLGPHVRGDI